MAYTTIDNPELYFQNKIYTGNGGTHSITFDGSEDMQPDLIWNKCRDAVEEPNIWDSVRGTGKGMTVSTGGAESSWATGVTSFDSDGWTMGSLDSMNSNTKIFASWNWKESATAGFDIVGYTGNGTDDTDISHNLSAVPKMIIVKNRGSNSTSWMIYHGANTAAPETDYLALDTTAATADAATIWSDEAPTASVFTLGNGSDVNENTKNIISYLWSEKQGFSKFGSYEGNGDVDGTFVYTGFKPAFVMTKSIDSTSSWHQFDNKREGYNKDNDALVAEANTVEATTDMIDLLSNGFKLRIATDPNVAETYIYMAFAEAPFVNSEGVPCNAR